MIDEWNDFLDAIREARQELGNPKIIWYRGHSSGQWNLIPGLHRWPEGLDKEANLFGEFQRTASRLFKKRDDDWETLFDMQHYGIPTRLLDWTEALGIAVAFAVLDHHPSHGDPALWVLDPVRLNKSSGLKGIKEIPSDGFGYKTVYWHNQPFAAIYPIAIAPTYQSDRMSAQRGTFTIHGRDGRAVDELCPNAIRKVPLPQTALGGAREFLDYADLNSYRIYPDIVGMARHISRKHLGQ